MDLYKIGNVYVGTQAEARAEAKRQGVRFDPAEHSEKVSTVKADLIAYLNKLVAAAAPNPNPIAAAASPDNAVDRPWSATNIIARMDQYAEVGQLIEQLHGAIDKLNQSRTVRVPRAA